MGTHGNGPLMTEDHTETSPDEGRPVGDLAWDDALCRLEDVLLALPFDEALPDLADLLDRARVPLSLVEHDERARKLLGEAILARPAVERDVVQRARVRVELLTLEVRVLRDRLQDPGTGADEVAAIVDRLEMVEQQLRSLSGGH